MCNLQLKIKNNCNYIVQIIHFLEKMFKLYLVLAYTFLKKLYISNICNGFSLCIERELYFAHPWFAQKTFCLLVVYKLTFYPPEVSSFCLFFLWQQSNNKHFTPIHESWENFVE